MLVWEVRKGYSYHHQNSNEAATSTFPPAASRVLIANSRVAPRSIKSLMLCSDGGVRCDRGGGIVGAPAVTPAGADPIVRPPPGNAAGAGVEDVRGVDEGGTLLVLASREGSRGSRALSGSSCSDRKRTSRPWILRTPFSRSMHAWWAFNMSKPRRRSTSRPCNETRMGLGYNYKRYCVCTSITVKEHGKNKSASFICALCTRPRILAVPTPRAMPENRVSRRRMRLKFDRREL